MGQLELNIDGYIEAKRNIREKVNETANNFIIIGFYLKQVRDSEAFKRDGYKNMKEFARAECGISGSTANRFININTKFSKGGNSPEIKDEYRNYEYSKLQEMLNIIPEDMELITEKTTVDQIQEIKKMEKEEAREAEKKEQENLPIVQMAAPDSNRQDAEAENKRPVIADSFEYILEKFWKENGELYRKAAAGMLTPKIAAEEICPSGSRLYACDISMLFFYDFDRGIKLRTYIDGSPGVLQYTYQDLLEKTAGMDIVFKQKKEKSALEEPVATSQHAPQTEPEDTKKDETPEEPENADAGKIIDAEYRELESSKRGDGRKKDENMPEAEYTDEQIKQAVSYFDIEYSRMLGLGQNIQKRTHYKMALKCIRKCYKSIAKEWDNEILKH